MEFLAFHEHYPRCTEELTLEWSDGETQEWVQRALREVKGPIRTLGLSGPGTGRKLRPIVIDKAILESETFQGKVYTYLWSCGVLTSDLTRPASGLTELNIDSARGIQMPPSVASLELPNLQSLSVKLIRHFEQWPRVLMPKLCRVSLGFSGVDPQATSTILATQTHIFDTYSTIRVLEGDIRPGSGIAKLSHLTHLTTTKSMTPTKLLALLEEISRDALLEHLDVAIRLHTSVDYDVTVATLDLIESRPTIKRVKLIVYPASSRTSSEFKAEHQAFRKRCLGQGIEVVDHC